MKRPLRERRDRAAERHDTALGRFPTREGGQFQRELQAVVEELTAVTQQADDPSSDPVEVAKTYRWLGDAYFDLGRGKEAAVLASGSQAYRRADELLGDADAPVEKAKLDFNYGNTLRGLSEGMDVGLLEAAQTRYEAAARAFRAHHLPDLAATVDQQLRAIDPQLRLARKGAEMQRGYGRLEELKERLENANAVERESIAKELADLERVPGRGDPSESLEEALEAISEQFDQHPERFGGEKAGLGALEEQIEALGSTLEDAPPEAAGQATRESDQEIARAVMGLLQKERAAGTVSPDRADQLESVFKQFTSAMAEGGDDLETLAKRSRKMRELMTQVMDPAMAPSWKMPAPEAGSRAHRAVQILEPLKRHLMAEAGRGMLPSDERSAGTDLMTRLFKLEARIRESQDDEGVASHEDRLWRLALDVQRHARRYHLIVAQPDFPMAATHAAAKSLFLSGDDALSSAARELSARDDLTLFEGAGRGDRARERWSQLSSASVSVFDVGVAKGAQRAQVCYELGLALALGKPTIVVARPRQRPPFDVNLTPIRFTGDRGADADRLAGAMDSALGSIVWGGAGAGAGTGTREALGWLDRRLGQRLSDGTLRIARQLAESHHDDAVAFHGALEQLLGMLGADAPSVLFPAWPPAYPDPTNPPRCFHVMPFRPGWARPTRDVAEEVCKENSWTYSRGDEAEAQRIIPGIWSEIGQASAALIDITGHNPNVALELGLVHALGRPYRVIAQGTAERHSFPSLEKVQIHSYGRGPAFSGLREIVEELLQ